MVAASLFAACEVFRRTAANLLTCYVSGGTFVTLIALELELVGVGAALTVAEADQFQTITRINLNPHGTLRSDAGHAGVVATRDGD